MGMKKRKVHPAANIFPMMNDADFEQLKASIEEIGLQEPVVLWREQVIDGRNRLRACEELGIESQEAELDDDVDPVAFTIAANQRRRNLTNKSQLAMCAAKMAGLKHGGDRKSNIKGPNGPLNDADALAAKEAGEVFGVGRTQVVRGLRVLREGCDKLIAQCANGEVAVSLACKLLDACGTKPAQSRVCKGGRAAVKKCVSPADEVEADDEVTPMESIEAITDAAATQLVGTKVADNKTELKKLAAMDDDKQLEVAKKIAQGKANSVDEAIGKLPDPDRLFFEALEASVRKWINNDPVRLAIAVESLDTFLDELRTD